MTMLGKTLPFREVDVFASAGFAGNPVAVIHDAGDLTGEQMQQIANWTNFSETTFLLPPTQPGADYRVRIFTTHSELPFAGHPTLGTCRAWLDSGGVPREAGRIVQECEAGLIPLRQDGDLLAFAAPPMTRSGQPTGADRIRAVAALGVPEDQVRDVQWIDNGPGWIGVLLDSAETVLSIEPVPVDSDPIAVVAVGPHGPGSECAIELRAFFGERADAVMEDPVTGSANASVAQWLSAAGRISLPYVAAQGTVLGRQGRIFLSESEGDVWVGGHSTVHVVGGINC